LAWRIEFGRSASRELAGLDPQDARRITGFLRNWLAKLDDEPVHQGAPHEPP